MRSMLLRMLLPDCTKLLFMKEKIDFLSDQFRKEDFWERRFYVEKFITWFEAKFA